MVNKFLEIAILLGAVHGLVAAGFYFLFIKKRPSIYFLSFGLFAMGITLVRLWLFQQPINHSLFFALPLTSDLVILPCFYLYLLSISRPDQKLKNSEYLWFLPWLVFFSYSIAFYVVAIFEPTLEAKNALKQIWHYSQIKWWEDAITPCFNLLLSCFLLRELFSKGQQIKSSMPLELSESKDLIFKFLVTITALNIAISGFQISNNLFSNYLNSSSEVSFFWFYNVIVVYSVGFLGFILFQSPKFVSDNFDELSNQQSLKSLDKANISLLEKVILKEEQYKNPNLSLTDLAKKLSITPNATSKLINHHFGKNFRALINELRISAVQKALLSTEFNQQSILSIALESGFQSEASFYRAFKNHTGMSPTEYKTKFTTS